MEIHQFLTAIPPSESDLLLHSWGFDLVQEYFLITEQIPNTDEPIIELATGTGRMCAVLATLFPKIVTGDISLLDFPRAHRRIPTGLNGRLTYLQLDMKNLPFKTNSIDTLVCMNTLHEISSPLRCLGEMIRVMKQNGLLVIGDFNELGFDTMQRIHETVYHNNHDRGSISTKTVNEELLQSFNSIRSFSTTLNTTFFATRKR